SDGSVSPLELTSRRISNARTAPSSTITDSPSSDRMRPPADSVIELYTTTRPSYWAPVNTISCGLPCSRSRREVSIISSHVRGGSGVIRSSYQSSWTLVFFGAAYSLPSHCAVFSGPGRTSRSASALFSPVHSSIHPRSEEHTSELQSRDNLV